MMRTQVARLTVALALLPACTAPEPPPESPALARQCEDAVPTWFSYDEDLKAALGASAVAHWSGTPIMLAQHADAIRLTLRLDPPWSDYAAVLPVLLRDPRGKVTRSADATRDGATRTYLFKVASGRPFPWVDVRLPRDEIRLTLDAAGRWRSAEAGGD